MTDIPRPTGQGEPRNPAGEVKGGSVRTARRRRLQMYQLEALARQAARVPLPVLIAAGFVAATVHGFVPWPHIAAWIVGVLGALLGRWAYARYASSRPVAEVGRSLAVMALLSAVNGFVTGLASMIFMPALPYERQAILTMVMVGWAAGAVAANAAYAYAFLAYSIPLLGLLGLHWMLSGQSGGPWIALLVLLFLVIESGFVRDNERVFKRSFAMRYRNEYLLRKLREERQAVLYERDRAEEANRAKSRFLAHASHDLRQPLAAIAINGEVLAKRASEGETREVGREIVQSIESLARLLDRLLQLSNLEAGTIKPQPMHFSLDRLLRRLVNSMQPMAARKGLRMRLESEGRLTVHTDPLLLEDALSNLLHNAIKYTEVGEVSVRASSQGPRALIEISDTGPGIPESEHERIFEPLYQLSNPARDRSQGVGLGLANVREVTRLLGIGLSLHSALGSGTTFRLALELADVPDLGARPAASLDEHDALPPGLHALVVDDESAIRRGLGKLLEDWGMTVTLAESYETAVRHVESERFDLLVTDYRLPAGRTGIDVLNAARRSHPALAAVLVSGDTAEERKREAEAAGLVLLEKPVTAASLQTHIARALRSAQ